MFSTLQSYTLQHLTIAKYLSRNPKFWLVLATDILLLILALFVSYSLRFESSSLSTDWFGQFLALFPVIVLVKIVVFYFFGLYRGMWRYTSTRDLISIMQATVASALLLVAALLFINRFAGLSRSVFILDTIFTFLFISGHRVAIRFVYGGINGSKRLTTAPPEIKEKKRLLLVGAGDAAEKVLREINSSPLSPYLPVGLLDDEPAKIGLKIHGVPVVGVVEDLAEHIKRTAADEVLISIAAARREDMKRFIDLCQSTGIPFKVIPGFSEILDGKVSVKAIRDISYKDLLGRERVILEQEKIDHYITGKTVLVTGAGGSIGSELCRQVLRFHPGRLILFDASEENLFEIQMELVHERDAVDPVVILGKVQDVRLLDLVFSEHSPAVVFHAAAYKHVPMVECNPWQAVNNNVFATQLLIEASIIHGVERFVLVSTDKAVRPTNVMGASKRLTELLMQGYDHKHWDGYLSKSWRHICKEHIESHSTHFMAVRFGNVIGSSGSVIPFFKKQIERGGPVTVTHPEITRYFMLVEEAALLILQSGSMGDGGEIFILKMGEPIKIDRMARDLIRLAGKEPDSEIEVKYTQLREGEKLYEELITEGEGIVDTHHEKIMVLRGNSFIPCSQLHEYLERLATASKAHSGPAIKEILHDVIPEYTPS